MSAKNLARLLPLLFSLSAWAETGAVRLVTSTSCQAISVKVALGMTTQIKFGFGRAPKSTLYADKKHFMVVTNATSPNSVAIIPLIEQSEIDSFTGNTGRQLPEAALVANLNRSFTTNLFVFFDHGDQLLFDLKFTPKAKADRILKVTETYDGRCEL